MYARFALTIISYVFFASSVHGANTHDQHCQLVPDRSNIQIIPEGDTRVHILGDNFRAEQFNEFSVQGNVNVRTGIHSIEAEQAQYNRNENQIKAQGQIRYRENNVDINGQSLTLDLVNKNGTAEQTQYKLIKENARGEAGKINFRENHIELHDASYTTCPDGENQWRLKAKSIVLKQAENEGIARHTRLEIMSVPILYLPYISFPLAGRKTGFLPPSPAYSSSDGFELSLPYYLNLAPNYDLSLTPRYIETRGILMGSEFRYLQPKHSGEFGIEYLPDDRRAERDRLYGTVNLRARAFENTNFALNYAHISDQEYFHDLSTSLNSVNTTQLSRNITMTTSGERWRFNGLLQDYQILGDGPEPYRRLPQLDFGYQQQLIGLSGAFQSQYTYFRKNDQDKVQRLLLQPSISAPIQDIAGYFEPSLSLHYADYRQESANNQQDFYNWLFKSEAGVFLERDAFQGIQTLEPRLAYIYVPYKDQSDLPRIDSGVKSLNIEQLFASNRYSGGDRVGDDNRVTFSLTSRLLSASGNEHWSIQYAHARFLADHKINLPGERTMESGDSINALSLKSQITTYLSGNAQLYTYSIDNNKPNKSSVGLKYQKNNQNLEIDYRFRDGSVEQASGLGIINLNPQWRLAGRWLYSLKHQQTQEALLGLEYNTCCWSLRFATRRYFTSADEEMKTSFGLQIELKGLARIGSSVDKEFSDEVFGNQ